MKIPFTIEQFFDVFGTYNAAIWPAQILAYILGVLAIIMAFLEGKVSDRIICSVLAFFWIWMGFFYHIIYFSEINPGAWIFGIAFVIQGALFLFVDTILEGLAFKFTLKPLPIIGACLIFYAMVIYPLIGISLGHYYPESPMFGVAPCPATIFTFGILLWTTKPVPVYLLIVPFIWSLIGTSAAVNLKVFQDYGLVVSGILGTVLILIKNRKLRMSASG